MVQKAVLLFCIREFYILCLEELKSAQRIVKKGIVVDWYHGRMIGMSVKRLLLVCMMILCLVPFGVSSENAAPTQPPAPPDQWPEITPEPENLRTD